MEGCVNRCPQPVINLCNDRAKIRIIMTSILWQMPALGAQSFLLPKRQNMFGYVGCEKLFMVAPIPAQSHRHEETFSIPLVGIVLTAEMYFSH